jgi:hypothetical protein
MVVDFPWWNDVMADLFTDTSDIVAVPFGLFYQNMNIAATFLVGLAVCGVLAILVNVYYASDNNNK